ncbi:hypothetical protein ABKA04_005768 [Annulohypoxylon sp. FPYF3050]
MTSSSPLTSTNGLPIKYTVEHTRKDGVSDKTLMDWFHNVHLTAGLPLMKKYGIIKYAVHVQDPKVGAAFQLELDQVRPGWEVRKCDLVLEYWTYDMGNLKSLIMDSEWQEKAVKGEGDIFDVSKPTVIHIGYDTTYLSDGQIINLDPK